MQPPAGCLTQALSRGRYLARNCAKGAKSAAPSMRRASAADAMARAQACGAQRSERWMVVDWNVTPRTENDQPQ